jgi:hypothetical protein
LIESASIPLQQLESKSKVGGVIIKATLVIGAVYLSIICIDISGFGNNDRDTEAYEKN